MSISKPSVALKFPKLIFLEVGPTMATRSKTRRWARMVVLLAAILFVGIAWWWLFAPSTLLHAIADARAEADRLDPGWRFADLEAARANIPEEQNASLRVLSVARLLPPNWLAVPAGRPSLAEELAATPSGSDPDLELLGRIRSALQKSGEALGCARTLATLNQGRFPVQWTDDGYSTPMPHLENVRDVINLLDLDTRLLTHDRKLDEAAVSWMAMVNAARSIGDEPSIVSQSWRRSLCRMNTLEGILSAGQVSESKLGGMQIQLEAEEREPLLLRAARSYRASVDDFLRTMEEGRLDRAALGLASPSGLPALDRRRDRREALACHAQYLRYLNECVEITKLPLEKQRERWLEPEFTPPPQLPKILGTDRSFSPIALDFLSAAASLRCAIAGIAAERYRIAHGDWPAQLSDLVPRYLAAVPVDPSDGGPLQYEKTNSGLTITAPGWMANGEKRDGKGPVTFHVIKSGTGVKAAK